MKERPPERVCVQRTSRSNYKGPNDSGISMRGIGPDALRLGFATAALRTESVFIDVHPWLNPSHA